MTARMSTHRYGRIVQDVESGDVLMLAYMNREAYEQTLLTRRVTFFSRSRQALWLAATKSGARTRRGTSGGS